MHQITKWLGARMHLQIYIVGGRILQEISIKRKKTRLQLLTDNRMHRKKGKTLFIEKGRVTLARGPSH